MYHIYMESIHGSTRSHRKNAETTRSLASEVTSILVFGLAVFVFFALISYHQTDPSLFTNTREAARNACGKVGAYFSSFLLECFGIGSFLMPAALLFMAAAIYKREGSLRLLLTIGSMSVATMTLTVFLSLQWKYWPYSGSLLLTGGAFGAWCSELLLKQFNHLGSSLVSIILCCLAVVLSTPISVARVGAKILRVVSILSWRISKLILGYFAYIVGLLLMRIAQVIGDSVQKAIEVTLAKAKERRLAKSEAKLITTTAELVQLTELPEENDKIENAEIQNSEIQNSEMQNSVNPTAYTEVPNALPELEKKQTEGQSSVSMQMLPTILPPESATALTKSSTEVTKAMQAAERAASKLARLAKMKKGAWKLPAIDFLAKPPRVESIIDKDKLIQNSQILKQKFADFGIEGEVTAVRPGPVITLYEFKPGAGVKVSRIAALVDDLSMALSAQSVRILAPLPGKSVVGIEIPSQTRQTVYLREFLQHQDFFGTKNRIPLTMGKDIGGQPYISDLNRMPHLLCAGQTGAGKSVFMNGLICSLLYRFTPDELRMILVDPKVIEFQSYHDLPHLLLPVVDDPKQASVALKWAAREMDRRYRILAKLGARNLAAFNEKVDEMGIDVVRDLLFSEENQDDVHTPISNGGDWMESFEPDETGAPRVGKLPYIVVIIDELADLMMIARKEVEVSITRIAQKARAAGIHLIVATQRPSTDVITGLIKSNLPSRVSFQLASYIDSKTILDRAGAERLLGRGDMLFIPPETSQLIRLHGALVSDEEIEKITAFLRAQGKPIYRDEILVDEDEEDDFSDGDDSDDELFQEAIELVKRVGTASASFLQRHLKVGYNRAARMIETMETRGIVGPADGSKPREVLLR